MYILDFIYGLDLILVFSRKFAHICTILQLCFLLWQKIDFNTKLQFTEFVLNVLWVALFIKWVGMNCKWLAGSAFQTASLDIMSFKILLLGNYDVWIWHCCGQWSGTQLKLFTSYLQKAWGYHHICPGWQVDSAWQCQLPLSINLILFWTLWLSLPQGVDFQV